MLNRLLPLIRTVQSRVMLLILIVGILPYTYLGYRNYVAQRTALIQQSEQLLVTSANTITIILHNFIGEIQRDARGIASLPVVINQEEESLQGFLDYQHTHVYDDLAKLAIIDLKGDILLASERDPDAQPVSISHIASFQEARLGKQSWVVDVGIQTPKLMLHMHTPIKNEDGELLAVLGTPVIFETLARQLSDMVVQDTGASVYIVERIVGTEKVRTIQSSNSAELDFNLLTPAIFSYSEEPGIRAIQFEMEGRIHQLGYANVPGTEWIVLVDRPLELAFPGATFQNRFRLAALLTAVILGIGIAVPASNFVSRPVRQLVAVAEALGAGRSDVPLPDSSKVDVDSQVLINAFANMRKAVTDRQNSLEQSEAALMIERNQLSDRVNERTAELQETNVKLEKALRNKEEFLSNVSHELRTPLNIVLGLLEALIQGVYQPLEKNQSTVVSKIYQNGTNLLGMINNVMDVSRLTSGELELVSKPFHYHDVCLTVIDEVRETCQSRHITLSYTPFESQDLMIRGDRLRVLQILCHLMANAVRFTPVGGRIRLRVTKPSSDKIHFSIADSGIGIAEKNFGRIFEPFEQIDNSLSRQFEGAGLGLALAQQYAQLHGGEITVTSQLHQGSTFTLILPYSEIPVGEQPVVQPNGAVVRPKILLAEDNEMAIQTVSDYLIYFGYDVIPARTGHEVLDCAHSSEPDLILMDVQMPGLDGLECTRRLRADAHLSNIPIIALTGMAMKQDEARCIAAGANAYMSKPVVLRELKERIDAFLPAGTTKA